MIAPVPPSNLTVEVFRSGPEVVAHLRGEVDVTTVGELRDAVEPFLGPSQTVVLDLHDVTFADSSLLNVLVQARGTLTDAGGTLLLRNPSVIARRLLTVMELTDLVDDEVERQNDAGNG
jgi:stage II sporulation protein AA (anti-sigma F factor antagonist)